MIRVSVYPENTALSFDKSYDYLVDNDLASTVKSGCRVLIPFGKYNAVRQGLVFDVTPYDTATEEKFHLKKVTAVIDKSPILNEEMLNLLPVIKERYFCTIFQALNLIIPTGLKYAVNTLFSINPLLEHNTTKLSERDSELVSFLKETKNGKLQSELIKHFGKQINSNLARLTKQGILCRTVTAYQKTKEKSINVYSLCESVSRDKLTKKQKTVCDFLKSHPNSNIKEICYYTGITSAVVNTLEKKGIINAKQLTTYRIPSFYSEQCKQKQITLSEEQNKAFNSLKSKINQNNAYVSLLYGITGSGKTSVFMKLIDYVRNSSKSGIILMVPEIALTAKLISIFKSLYGDDVAVFHSGLSSGERLDEYKRVKSGKANIVIGTRSAIFAPIEKIGLIIMDEEQESSYKSTQNPCFDAHDIAKIRCKNHSCLLLLCSATPSLESFYNAQNGTYGLETLKKRFGTAVLPDVRIIDMNNELANGNGTIFSEELLERLQANIDNREQSILLLNRRGYNTFASCKMCGEVVTCPNCSISLTYHSANNKLMCHYCGYSTQYSEKCPSCGEPFVRCSGFGTQKIEKDLQDYLGNARILRMDADTTLAKNAHDEKLRQFENGDFDIMLGTQMVAKGLDFENVTLVGVLLADQSLYCGEFRSYEKTFDLLTQVVGRAGRGSKKGVAVIQTFTPENDVILMAANQDYDKFYESEITVRQAMLYPPFANICVLTFVSTVKENAQTVAKIFFDELKKVATQKYPELPLRVLAPVPATVAKVSNRYRYKIIIKCKNNKKFRQMIWELLVEFSDEKNVKISASLNPDSVL